MRKKTMRGKHIAGVVCFALLLGGCMDQTMTDDDKQQAKTDYEDGKKAADIWLKEFDVRGYEFLLTVESPPSSRHNPGKKEKATLIEENKKQYGIVALLLLE